MTHLSVLLPEVLHYLDLSRRSCILDATLGLGGHTRAILSSELYSGNVIGVDQDQSHLKAAEKNLADFSSRFRGVHMNFGDLRSYFESEKLVFDGILFDLGVASPHFDLAERGFSYQVEGPLDMRMDQSQSVTAEHIVNTYEEHELTKIFYAYGEEPLSKKIAYALVRSRSITPYKTTTQLKNLIVDVYRSAGFYSSKKNPATKVFQALRIAVNDELRVLEEALKVSVEFIQPGGRILVMSYHSLEDRMVKDFFKTSENPCICPPKLPICACERNPQLRILTKKPILPGDEEIRKNPRARSAKLRVAEKI